MLYFGFVLIKLYQKIEYFIVISRLFQYNFIGVHAEKRARYVIVYTIAIFIRASHSTNLALRGNATTVAKEENANGKRHKAGCSLH